MGLLRFLSKINSGLKDLEYFLTEKKARYFIAKNKRKHGNQQDLDIYWDPSFLEGVKTWGLGTAWTEIQLFLAGCEGRVLDIGCGTGAVMSLLRKNEKINLHGCDISDFLITEAVNSGIPQSMLTVCDATKMPFTNNEFNFSYSIGTLEHFTEKGIVECLNEVYRVTRRVSFHQVPVTINGEDDGWIIDNQSYYNNSVNWWLEKFKYVYDNVYVFDSVWRGSIHVGKWFVCIK